MIKALPLRILLPAACLGLSLAAAAGESPYFPERGSAAIRQRALDLRTPAVVLAVALEPGDEDLPLLAYLRMGLGARVINLYVTGGSSTPSDAGGESPAGVAGRRKGEAYRVSTLLGMESYFLNLPDAGIIRRKETLERFWIPDSVLPKLNTVILSYRPDAIIVQRDFHAGEGMTTRQRSITGLLMRSIAAAGSPLPAQIASGMTAWHVARVFADTGAGTYRANVSLRNPVWKMTYGEIGARAGRLYESLRVRRAEWEKVPRSYGLLSTALKKDRPASILAGLPLMNRRVRSLAGVVARASVQAETLPRPRAIESVARAIDTVEHALYRESAALGEVGNRVLATWKNGLEDLRCSLFDLRISFASSDSLLTGNQLFFLRFTGLTGSVDTGRTEIIFPLAMKHVWGIDESVNYRFRFSVPREFRVITPDKPEYTMPASTFGLDRPRPRTQFPFIIFHSDAVRSHNFAYRKEIPLGVGPIRSVEILTPVVRMVSGARVAFSLMNFSRDGFEGDVYLSDSLVSSPRRHVRLLTKDEALTDTLTITCRENVPPGDYPVRFFIAGKPLARVTARSFEAVADTTSPVGLLTGITGSPVEAALAGLRVPVTLIGSGMTGLTENFPFSTIVIDEEAAAQRGESAGRLGALRSWVARGGNLVILPQFLSPRSPDSASPGCTFRHWPPLEPGDSVATGGGAPDLLQYPNRIGAGDWDGWVVSRALGWVDTGSSNAETVVRSASTGNPLLVTLAVGKGRVTLVALDIVSQLRNVNPGACRLLANLVARRLAR